jgi:hypothetical protein
LVDPKESDMSSTTEIYVLTVKCRQCTFQVTQEAEVEPEQLIEAKTEMLKQAASIHKKHGDLSNFEVY